jgi:hypothetical protein
MATFHENLKQSFKNFKNKYIGNVPSGVTLAQINTDLTDIREEINNMSALPLLDFANPIHTFDENHLTYTANDVCYLFGSLNSDLGRNFSINNTPILNPTSNVDNHRPIIPMIKLHAGDVVDVTGDFPQPYLHVYHEVTT